MILTILAIFSLYLRRGAILISSGSCYNAFIYMLLYFIAFVRPQPIAVRRGERPERGRPTLIDHTASVSGVRRCMRDEGRARRLAGEAAFNVCAHYLFV